MDPENKEGAVSRRPGYRRQVAATWSSLVGSGRRGSRRERAALVPALATARERLLPNIPFIIRLTAAAVVSYLLVEQVYPGMGDLTGALTAMLVVRASVVETFSSGLDRIVAVLSGVLVATAVASVTGLTWWSLAIVVATALAMGWIFDLTDNRLETAISAMLILGASSPDTSAEARAVMTLIGAAVGFGSTVLFPPPVLSTGVSQAVARVAERASAATRATATEMGEGLTSFGLERWVRSLHRVLPLVASADVKVRESENRRKYNPRALGKDEAIPVLRAGLSSLDRVVLALRHALMSLQTRMPSETHRGVNETERALEGALGVVFEGIAHAIEQYGVYVAAESRGDAAAAAEARRGMSTHVEETRAMVTELALADPGGGSAWMLHPSVLSSLDAVLVELSSERLDSRLEGWRARQSADAVFSSPVRLDRRRLRVGHRRGDTPISEAKARPDDPAVAPPTLAITYRDLDSVSRLADDETEPRR